MEYALAALVLAALVALVLRPVVRGVDETVGSSTAVEELEAAKEAKYREIRDVRLDYEMGKVTKEDLARIDRELRGEAIDILRRLDLAQGREPPA